MTGDIFEAFKRSEEFSDPYEEEVAAKIVCKLIEVLDDFIEKLEKIAALMTELGASVSEMRFKGAPRTSASFFELASAVNALDDVANIVGEIKDIEESGSDPKEKVEQIFSKMLSHLFETSTIDGYYWKLFGRSHEELNNCLSILKYIDKFRILRKQLNEVKNDKSSLTEIVVILDSARRFIKTV